MRYFLTTLSLVVILLGCRKEESNERPISGTPIPFMDHIAIQTDSAFIMAPNLVTPNADGLNDEFSVIGRYVSAMETEVMAINGSIAFYSTSLNPVWSDIDSSDVGRYRVTVTATSLSGVDLSGRSDLDIMLYGQDTCLLFDGTPITSDQLDPRAFGVSYSTNEVFCQ
jgi:hypothetical protein